MIYYDACLRKQRHGQQQGTENKAATATATATATTYLVPVHNYLRQLAPSAVAGVEEEQGPGDGRGWVVVSDAEEYMGQLSLGT